MWRAPVLAVAGGTASGKSTLAEALATHHPQTVAIIHLDDHYVPAHDPLRGVWTVSATGRPVLDWNHPGSIDEAAVADAVERAVVAPGVRLVVVEGLFALTLPSVTERARWRVYVDTPDDVRLARKILRKIELQRQDPRVSLLNYLAAGRQRHAEHVAPSRGNADLVVDGAASGPEMLAEVMRMVGPALAEPVRFGDPHTQAARGMPRSARRQAGTRTVPANAGTVAAPAVQPDGSRVLAQPTATVASSSATMPGPFSVSTDSGWNCTPANPDPRIALTSPVAGSRHSSMPCIASSSAASASQRAVKEL
jgi:uridine kinase